MRYWPLWIGALVVGACGDESCPEGEERVHSGGYGLRCEIVCDGLNFDSTDVASAPAATAPSDTSTGGANVPFTDTGGEPLRDDRCPDDLVCLPTASSCRSCDDLINICVDP